MKVAKYTIVNSFAQPYTVSSGLSIDTKVVVSRLSNFMKSIPQLRHTWSDTPHIQSSSSKSPINMNEA
jgi:hypothetical protein